MLNVLFEDAHCLAVNKPAGLLIQGRTGGEETLESIVRRYLAGDDTDPVYLGIVHRLDRPVSGVVIWAKNPKAARRLAEQFASRETIKQYRAAVSPPPSTAAGTWDDWLSEDGSAGHHVQICTSGTPRARQAITRFQQDFICPGRPEIALLTLWPQTGRTHQLRVQCAARNWPILGDSLYGSSVEFPTGIALHAAQLSVRHPITNRMLTLSAELPDSWNQAGLVTLP